MQNFKNMTAESYNLLNIEENEEKPYFFGMGFPSRFNCNQGFSGDTDVAKKLFSQVRIKSPVAKSKGEKIQR